MRRKRVHKKHVYIHIYIYIISFPKQKQKTKPKTYHTSKFLGVPFCLIFLTKKKSAKFAKTLISISEGSGVPPESGEGRGCFNQHTELGTHRTEQPLTKQGYKAGIPFMGLLWEDWLVRVLKKGCKRNFPWKLGKFTLLVN